MNNEAERKEKAALFAGAATMPNFLASGYCNTNSRHFNTL